eukprot:02818.XXX_11477_11932_1 [CDS] Oithona nana genome sequencing.
MHTTIVKESAHVYVPPIVLIRNKPFILIFKVEFSDVINFFLNIFWNLSIQKISAKSISSNALMPIVIEILHKRSFSTEIRQVCNAFILYLSSHDRYNIELSILENLSWMFMKEWIFSQFGIINWSKNQWVRYNLRNWTEIQNIYFAKNFIC